MTELRLTVALVAMLVVPGWAILAFAPRVREWETLQRWCLAVSLSIAFYPVLFYGTRAILPTFQWGPHKLGILLLVGAGVIAWRLRANWREQFAFERMEWIALAIFAMTLFSRFWIIRDQPVPAWTDSLHHAILTRLTAQEGRLPFDMAPYFPIPLGQYHLGLYALSGTLELLSGALAHTALLWMAQALNGLCGLSVFFVLDRKVGRIGAIVGAATVGLFSFQPAWYVNWGRFTQVASQTIVLVAWLMTWDALRTWRESWTEPRGEIIWKTSVAACLTAAVFLLHFRVAGFYLPLLAIAVVWEWIRARSECHLARAMLGTLVVGFFSLVLVSPALWEALRIYLSATLQTPIMSDDVMVQANIYYAFPWDSVFAIGAEWWIIALAGSSALLGLIRRNGMVIANLVWVALLIVIGDAYLLRFKPLAFTNMGAILIALYLPMGLIVGAGAAEALKFFRAESRQRAANAAVGVTLALGFIATYQRATAIEPFRYFVTAPDLAAMDWINHNTPPDARFAINTFFWLPNFPHGTDAGYWIPYFTGRQTTTGPMLFPLGGPAYADNIAVISHAAKQLGTDSAATAELRSMGVDYVYIGAKGNFSEPGLDAAQLSQVPGVTLAYRGEGVTILQIQNPN